MPFTIKQSPEPGSRRLAFCGDTAKISLILSEPISGTAWLRSNVGRAAVARNEVIEATINNTPYMGRDFFDVPMRDVGQGRFEIIIGLSDPGHFEGKAFFLPSGKSEPVWPKGPNIVFNVLPARASCANIIYNSFVRQFGPNISGIWEKENAEEYGLAEKLDKIGCTVIPPSGTFRDVISRLDFICGKLGCRFIQLLPIHPTPTIYGRMGRFGSPYASLNFMEVDPALAQFDLKATPMEQFEELVDAVHSHNAYLLLDIAVNHTGWGAELHWQKPEWYEREPDGKIVRPGAWGVVWEDLAKLDYSHKDLWKYIANIFLVWCRRGVDGFRCDAGYMIPIEAWRFIIATVRSAYPDTIFLLEGLGGKISITRELLNSGGFDWAYSELFQNYDFNQIKDYLPQALEISSHEGLTVHFAETHDNNRLAAKSFSWARMRTALCALLSVRGAFGFANGVEWFATEKISVHEARSLNWGAPENQTEMIARISRLLRSDPVFTDNSEIKIISDGSNNTIAVLRHNKKNNRSVLVIVNLTDARANAVFYRNECQNIPEGDFLNLLDDKTVRPVFNESTIAIDLGPYEILCLLSADSKKPTEFYYDRFDALQFQELCSWVLEIRKNADCSLDLDDFDMDQAVKNLYADVRSFCKEVRGCHDREDPKITSWKWPHDIRRHVMIPPGHFIIVSAEFPFRARIEENNRVIICKSSFPVKGGEHIVVFCSINELSRPGERQLFIDVYTGKTTLHDKGTLLFLESVKDIKVKKIYPVSISDSEPIIFLNTNGRGAMLRMPVFWGEIRSKYDAILAANLNPSYPEDRWVMLTSCRIWTVFRGVSHPLNRDCLENFIDMGNNGGMWKFKVPTGQGKYIYISIRAGMVPDHNQVFISITRHHGGDNRGVLPDDSAVRIILRPDIESRNFHETTKAYMGAENKFPLSLEHKTNGFSFSPSRVHCLSVKMETASWTPEAEWRYMLYRPADAERNQDANTDLFSPGYFSKYVSGGETISLDAFVGESSIKTNPRHHGTLDINTYVPFSDAIKTAMEAYIVRREGFQTVIAGYPWFMDWGRDTLIFARGLVAAGKIDTVKNILKLFGKFERNGTLPNMIQGDNASNRNTSDAPLWYAVVCNDLMKAANDKTLPSMKLDGEGDSSILSVIKSLAVNRINGMSNGIVMDKETCLIFSPPHFTWMDTNYPACTPREGYPIEIQALWLTTIKFLAENDTKEKEKWQHLAKKIESSIVELYWDPDLGYLLDCLQGAAGTKAKNTEKDDALRPNQLLALTLGAISDKNIAKSVLNACESLIVPGAIRSLADRAVGRPLYLNWNGYLLGDPYHPYKGIYSGDEDTSRKPAYHNGTAWTWLFPSYAEAWLSVYGASGLNSARAWLSSSVRLMETGCVGHIPEIIDGDAPHLQKGCDAQAWGASELYRVWSIVQSYEYD